MSQPSSSRSDRFIAGILKHPLRVFLPLILLLTVLAYSNTLYSPLTLDDTHTFVEDSSVYLNDFSFSSLAKLSNSHFGTWRFLPMLSFAVNHKIFKGDIPYYHITNILIHLLVAIILFFFTLRLAGTGKIRSRFLQPPVIAFLVAGLWALNPVQTNAVTYLVQRMTSMACMFYLGSLCFYVYGRTTANIKKRILFLALSGLCAVAAFFSKENSATLPMALIMTETFFINPGVAGTLLAKIKPRYWLLLAIFLLLLTPPATTILHSLTNYSQRSFTLSERILTESRVVIWYISLLLLPLPSRMSLEHDFPISHGLLNPPSTIFSLLAIIFLIILAWKIRNKTPLISFGIIWFFLNLVIESTIIPLEIAFEHRLYLPSIGIFLALAGMINLAYDYVAKRKRIKDLEGAAVLFVIVLLCLSSVLTTLRNYDWRSELSIYRDCATKSPNKARAVSELGLALAKNGSYADAIKYSKEAIRLGRPYREVYCTAATNCVLSLDKLGKRKEAIKQAEKYLEEIPDRADQGSLWTLLYNQAKLYLEIHQPVKAFNSIKKALLLQRANSNQVTTLMAMAIINDAYSNPEAKTKLKLEGDIQRKVILLKMAELMVQVRDYQQARIFLNLAENEFPNAPEVEKFATAYAKIMVKNIESQAASEISNQQSFSHLDYRLAWLGISFIIKYYKPLIPIAAELLERMIRRYPNDPFLTTIDLRYKLINAKPDFDLKDLETALNAHPNFIPLIKLAINVYRATNDKENTNKLITRLLDIYPGVDNWRTLLFIKETSDIS